MGISCYKEVTVWNNPEFRVPQNVYLFDGKSNALAYAKESNGEIFIFKKPLPIDTRRRKFIKVSHKALDEYGATVAIAPPPEANNINIFMVQSDSGKTYTVELIAGKYSCNCIGFAYRGKCKHSQEIKDKAENK